MSRLNVGIGIAVALAVTALFVVVIVGRCTGCEAVAVEDQGAIEVRLESGERVRVRLGFETYEVVGHESVDDAQLAAAIDFWSSSLGVQRLAGRVDHGRYMRMMDGPEKARGGLLLISVEELPSHRCGGEATLNWDRRTGHLIYSVVRVAKAHTYDTPHYQAALRHELGHGLRLADDPPSRDLNSIMSSRLLVHGEVTAHDAALFQGIQSRPKIVD